MHNKKKSLQLFPLKLSRKVEKNATLKTLFSFCFNTSSLKSFKSEFCAATLILSDLFTFYLYSLTFPSVVSYTHRSDYQKNDLLILIIDYCISVLVVPRKLNFLPKGSWFKIPRAQTFAAIKWWWNRASGPLFHFLKIIIEL